MKNKKPKLITMEFRKASVFLTSSSSSEGVQITRVIIIFLLIVYIVKFYRFINNS